MMAELYYNAKVYVEKGHYEQAVLVEDGIIRRIGSSDALLADAPADAGGLRRPDPDPRSQ